MDTNAITCNSSSTSTRKPGSQRGVASRVNTASRKLLRTLLNNFVEEPACPIVLHLEENKSLQLHNLTTVTKPTLHDRGVCVTELLYTQGNGFTCLTFQLNTVAGSDSAFTSLSLNVCLLDSETKDIIIPAKYEVLTIPDELYSFGVVARRYRIWTKMSFPLNVGLNICTAYMKEGKTKNFDTPGRGKFINYRLLQVQPQGEEDIGPCPQIQEPVEKRKPWESRIIVTQESR